MHGRRMLRPGLARVLLACVLLACVLPAIGLAPTAQAATLKLALLMQAEDPRLDPKRTELAYPGHPGGPLTQAVEMALAETQFELDAAKLAVEFKTVEANDAADAKARLQQLEKEGTAAALLDLPADWLAGAAGAVKLPLLNAGSADDTLRGAACQTNLFHTLPAERMRADALAQTLMARKWARVLLLHGPSADDAARLAVVQAALTRYGLKTVATKPYKLSADPRERELANPLLLTGGVEHDVVWVVDSDGEFARTLPYRTALPRPVVGDAGLTAQAWGPHFERFGAPQLARRFARAAKRPMTGHDWAAWIATKAVLQAAIAGGAAPSAAQMMKAMAADAFVLDGFKGMRVSFRAWDRQLRQPLLLTDGVGILATAPVDGVLHPKNVLDTLGSDERESACKAK
jgi:ABC transporter substrate binding protein (PQQ-dependent alcohol dehydrogenase system)